MKTQAAQEQQKSNRNDEGEPLMDSVTVPQSGVMTETPASNEVRIDRRRFTAQYKQRILAQAAQAKADGLVGKKRGRKPVPVNSLQAQVDRLNRELKRESQGLRQAEAIISLQKKYPRCWA